MVSHRIVDERMVQPLYIIGHNNGNTTMRAEINFTWWRERDPRDYVEIDAEAFRNRPSFVDVVQKGRQPRIVAKGIALESYHPLEKFPDLYERFAKLRSKDDAVKFIRTFGPLTDDGWRGGKGDSLYKVLRQAESMGADNLHIGVTLCVFEARLVAEHDGIHLRAQPSNLLDALWLQYADAAFKGLANRCPQCKRMFATGPDAKRRRGAEFCSVECKTKYHSLKRSRPQ
jgi:hypothetical protein